jgi:ectoine hydroxylase-related dioxygenase (phytanoyl-CoA dioxygenase family)
MRLATNEEKKIYDEQGYVIIKNIIAMEQVLAFREMLNVLVDALLMKASTGREFTSLSIDEKIITLKNISPDYVSHMQRVVTRSPEFFALTACVPVMTIMRSLYGLSLHSPVYQVNNGVVFTCPNDKANSSISNFETDWHNDVFYTIPGSQFWQVWMPLLNHGNTDIGSLVVCPGSHKDGVGKQHINVEAGYNNRYYIQEEDLSQYKPVSVDVNVGDIMIFDSRLIHKSGSNSSNKVRCTMLGAYHDVLNPAFSPVTMDYKYNGKTPEAYFYELFGDEAAKQIMYDDLAEADLSFKTGI